MARPGRPRYRRRMDPREELAEKLPDLLKPVQKQVTLPGFPADEPAKKKRTPLSRPAPEEEQERNPSWRWIDRNAEQAFEGHFRLSRAQQKEREATIADHPIIRDCPFEIPDDEYGSRSDVDPKAYPEFPEDDDLDRDIEEDGPYRGDGAPDGDGPGGIWPTDDGTHTGGPHGGKPPRGSTPTVVEVCAWYQPFHFTDDWGVFILAHCIERLWQVLAHVLAQRAPKLSSLPTPGDRAAVQNTVLLTSLRAAFLRYYLHEVFHHEAETFSTRCEAVVRNHVYRPGPHGLHLALRGNPEEPLAEAYMLKAARDSSRPTWRKWSDEITKRHPQGANAGKQQAKHARLVVGRALRWFVIHRTPWPYRRGGTSTFSYQDELQLWQSQCLTRALGAGPWALSLMSHMTHSYRRQPAPDFWIVVPKTGSRPPWLIHLEGEVI